MTMFHMSNDSHLFHTREQLETDGWSLTGNIFTRSKARMLPLYEAKMLHHYDHRLGTYEGQTAAQANMGTLPRLTPEQQDNPAVTALPRYWVPEPEIVAKLRAKSWNRNWLLGWRDICRSTDERTMISAAMPVAPIGHTYPLMFIEDPGSAGLLGAQLASFAFDYVTRQKIGGTHLTYGYVAQLPVFSPRQLTPHAAFITPRVLELTCTAHDMTAYARELGDQGAPFRWDEGRRKIIRAELDALFFHLYGVARDDVEYILETFPVVKRKDEANYGSYRTKELILDVYDRMAAAGLTLDNPLTETGPDATFTSDLTPPPGHGPRHPTNPNTAA